MIRGEISFVYVNLRQRLHTANESMIRIRHLVVCVCVYVSSVQSRNDDVRSVYQKLEWAEAMIKSAKEGLPSTSFPVDCEELFNNGFQSSGVYRVWPKSKVIPDSISVYCDMETDGGGWTVIQRRGNFSQRSDFFYQDWKAYKEGFGNLREDFWLGNNKIFALTNQNLYSIRIDLTAFDGGQAYANYDIFFIEGEKHLYRLHVEGYSGNAGDSLSYHSGRNFTTQDRDNDIKSNNCAEERRGAWWYGDCTESHLNGIYHQVKPSVHLEGVLWYGWKGDSESLAATEMKIRKFPSWGS